MTRRVYPDDRMVLGVPRVAGRPVVSRAGSQERIFLDEARTIPADILDLEMRPVVVLQVDELGRIPEFYGPQDFEGPLYSDAGNRLYPVEGRRGPEGPPGPKGAAGTQKRWYGHGPPGTIVGAQPDDDYVDLDTGDLYLNV